MNPTATTEPTPAPAMPYEVKMLRYGRGEGLERPTKVYPQGGGDLLTPDELAVWEYLKWLEEEHRSLIGVNSLLVMECEKLRAELAELRATVSAPPPSSGSITSAERGKGKK